MPDKHINELPSLTLEQVTPDKLMIIGDPETGTLYQITVGTLPASVISRFGIEDNAGLQNRAVDMFNFVFDIQGSAASYLQRFNNTGDGKAIFATAVNVAIFALSNNSLGLDVASNNADDLGAAQFTVGGGASPVNNVLCNVIVRRAANGTAEPGIGSSINFDTRTILSNAYSNRIISKWVDPTDATLTSQLQISGYSNAVEFKLTFPVITEDTNLPYAVNTHKADSTGKIEIGTQEFTDNADAISNGLTVGTIYRTGDVLKIVH